MLHVLSVFPDTLALLATGSAFFIAAALFRRLQRSATPNGSAELNSVSDPPLIIEGPEGPQVERHESRLEEAQEKTAVV